MILMFRVDDEVVVQILLRDEQITGGMRGEVDAWQRSADVRRRGHAAVSQQGKGTHRLCHADVALGFDFLLPMHVALEAGVEIQIQRRVITVAVLVANGFETRPLALCLPLVEQAPHLIVARRHLVFREAEAAQNEDEKVGRDAAHREMIPPSPLPVNACGSRRNHFSVPSGTPSSRPFAWHAASPSS